MRGTPPPSTTPSVGSSEIRNEWTKEEIKQLRNNVVLSQTVRILLDLAAERAGEWIDFTEICKKAGKTPRQAQGELAGFTQLIKRRFGKEGQGDWPVEVKWKNSPEEQTRYRMPPSIARWWNIERCNATVDDLKNGLIFEVEQCNSEALNEETAAEILNFFTDQVMDTVAYQGGNYLAILADHRHHVDQLYEKIAQDESCLPITKK